MLNVKARPLESTQFEALHITKHPEDGTVGALATGQLKPASKEFPRPGPLCFED